MRQPVVAGVAGGVGTSTMALAISGRDVGVYRQGPLDVLVCRDAVSSLGKAHRVIAAAATQPVLAVVAGGPSSMPKSARARLEMVRPHVALVVRVPWVPTWREVVDPWGQAALAVFRSDELPKSASAFGSAAREVYTQVLQRLRTTSVVPAPAPPARGPDPGPEATRPLPRPKP